MEFEQFQMAKEIFLSLNASLIHFMDATGTSRSTTWEQEIV
jgi:hypothetical protein